MMKKHNAYFGLIQHVFDQFPTVPIDFNLTRLFSRTLPLRDGSAGHPAFFALGQEAGT